MKRANGNGDASSIVHAMLYTRVSGAEHQKEGLSLDAQRSATREYAARQPGWIVSGEHEDIMSGKRADRPRYQEMLEQARQLHRERKRAAIVVVKLDRLGRNKAEYFKTAEELARQGAEVHSIKDGGVLDETHASILAVFAAKEAKDIGQRVGDTRATLVTNGHHYGRTAFGYHMRPATPEEIASGLARKTANGKSPRVFEPDPATRGVATEVFERVAAGQSINRVAQWLAGLPSGMRGGRIWPARCVATMLRSATYVGRPAEGVDDVLARPRARWEPLVSDETWEAVQDFLAGHEARPHQTRYLLSSFLRCPVCGERMVGMKRLRESGRTQYQYRCKGWNRGANALLPGCRWSVPMAPVDGAVLDQVAAVVEPYADPERQPALQRAWEALDQPATDGGKKRLGEIERELAASQRRLAKAAELLTDGTLDKLGYDALRQRAVATIEALESERARLQPAAQLRTSGRPALADVLQQAGGWSRILREADIPQQRAVLDVLVERVVPQRTGYRTYRVEIVWTALGRHLAEAAGPWTMTAA
jgi:DNA invertase Pin-like site-specific DNA recombinase